MEQSLCNQLLVLSEPTGEQVPEANPWLLSGLAVVFLDMDKQLDFLDVASLDAPACVSSILVLFCLLAATSFQK
ncbi:MAG: hypothetical protein HN675_12830 [Opitutae bacterium]|nr:hypothetical protein [Opitutae bacterium]